MDTIYVGGFMFSENGKNVALIRKQKPDWQAGLLNAIGGKVNQAELPVNAMAREFMEETGLVTCDWDLFCILENKTRNGLVYFFRKFDNNVINVRSMEEEHVEVFDVATLFQNKTMDNLKYLIPLALDKTMFKARIIDLS